MMFLWVSAVDVPMAANTTCSVILRHAAGDATDKDAIDAHEDRKRKSHMSVRGKKMTSMDMKKGWIVNSPSSKLVDVK